LTTEGGSLTGTWKDGEFVYGISTTPNSIYFGPMHNTKKHGKGYSSDASGIIYHGQYVDGEKLGKGIYFTQKGTAYFGEFRGKYKFGPFVKVSKDRLKFTLQQYELFGKHDESKDREITD
jgi:hypothetical protein